MKTFQRLALTATLAVSALLMTGCGVNSAQTGASTASPASASPSSSASVAPVVAPAHTASPAPTLPAGIVVKGVANDGKGNYLQTTIADSDPAMKYDPSLADAAAKAHYSAADLAETQKAAVKFIAEEAIDSTLNGGNGNVDSWWAAHKDEIHPLNQDFMLKDLKNNDGSHDVLATESWMKNKSGYSYVHGDDVTRVVSRTITPTALRFVQSSNLQGVMLDTKVTYSMKVTGGSKTGIQNSTGELSFAVAKDTDGKWKIAGYNTNFHTAEG